MRERFTRRCAAHLTALFERAEGYRLTDEDSQSRESGLWCPTHLPNSLSGHWVTRWVVWDNGTPDSPSQGQIARASVDDPVNGSAVELDEVFFKGMLQLLDEGSSVFSRIITPEDNVQSERVSESRLAVVHVTPAQSTAGERPGTEGLTRASMSMGDAHVAIIRAANGLVLTPVQDAALQMLGECTAIAWCPKERKRARKAGEQLELCWASPNSRADEWAEHA